MTLHSTAQSRTYYIKHIQRVAFDVPVFCEPTTVRLHPRLDGIGAVHWSKIEVTPQPVERTLECDENGNLAWQVCFHDLTLSLTVSVTSCVELFAEHGVTRPPGRYAESPRVTAFRRLRTSPSDSIESLIQMALRASDGTKLSYLKRLTDCLSERVGIPECQPMEALHGDAAQGESGLQCRLLSAATECLANAGRAQGIPSRIVRGYEASTGEEIEWNTRTWVEFYLDELGWVGFHASSGMIDQGDWIPVAIGATLQETVSLDGLYRGTARDPECTTQIVIRQAAAT